MVPWYIWSFPASIPTVIQKYEMDNYKYYLVDIPCSVFSHTQSCYFPEILKLHVKMQLYHDHFVTANKATKLLSNMHVLYNKEDTRIML